MSKLQVKKIDNTYSILNKETTLIQASGFPTMDMALHGVWVLNGSDHSHWYDCAEDGTVIKKAVEDDNTDI